MALQETTSFAARSKCGNQQVSRTNIILEKHTAQGPLQSCPLVNICKLELKNALALWLSSHRLVLPELSKIITLSWNNLNQDMKL